MDFFSLLEIETEVPSLESFVGWETVRRLKPKEKKRQEVINGFCFSLFYFSIIFKCEN